MWRFEVVYSFSSGRSSSSLNFLINRPPRNGSCSIQPENGTTTTPFIVSCPGWFDEDGIKDYSLLSSSYSYIHSSLHISFLSQAGQQIDHSARWSLFLRCRSFKSIFQPIEIRWTCWLRFVISEIVLLNGQICLWSVFELIRLFSTIWWEASSMDQQDQVTSFNYWPEELKTKLGNWSIRFHDKSPRWTKTIFKWRR